MQLAALLLRICGGGGVVLSVVWVWRGVVVSKIEGGIWEGKWPSVLLLVHLGRVVILALVVEGAIVLRMLEMV